MCQLRMVCSRLVLAVLLIWVGPSTATQLAALSPDGKWAAYEYDGGLWLVPTAGARKPYKIATMSYEEHFLPRWSPLGDRLAYYSKQSGTLQLWVYETGTRQSRELTSVAAGINPPVTAYLGGFGGDPLRYSWSPDGSKIVFSTQVEIEETKTDQASAVEFPSPERIAAGEPIVATTDTPPDWALHGVVSYGSVRDNTYTGTAGSTGRKPGKIPPPRRTNQLFIVAVNDAKITQLTRDDFGYFTPEWSPDGTRIAFMSGEGKTPDRNTLETNIFTLTLVGAKRTRITSGLMQKSIPLWSPDGQWIAWLNRDGAGSFVRREEGIFITRSDGSATPRIASQALDERGQLTFEWGPNGDSLFLTPRNGLIYSLLRVNSHTGVITPIAAPEATVTLWGLAFAASRGGIVWTQMTDPNSAQTLWYWDFKAKPRPVVEIEPAANLARERRREVVRWTNHRGESLDGLLAYPLSYNAEKKYPMIVDAYSLGSFSAGRRIEDRNNFMRASTDYFFFRPNHRAPHIWMNPMRDARYDATAVGPAGIAVMADDILSGVDSLIQRGFVDSHRLCVSGFSNGGQEGLQLLAQTDRFRCAVIQSPSTANWLNDVFLEYPEGSIRALYGITPWQDPSIYVALSAVFHADKINTPILLATGDREPGVLPTAQMYHALRYLKKDVTLLRYPNQGHGLVGAAEEDFTRRVESFFATYLSADKDRESHTEAPDEGKRLINHVLPR